MKINNFTFTVPPIFRSAFTEQQLKLEMLNTIGDESYNVASKAAYY
jgi:hypothetical protein